MKTVFTHSLKAAFVVMLALAVFSGCQRDEDPTVTLDSPEDYSNEVAVKWNTTLLNLERFTPGYRPPVSARNIGYINLAAFESIQPGMEDKYNSFDGFFPGLDVPEVEEGLTYHWPTVLNATYARIMTHFFPTAPAAQLFEIFRLESDFNDAFRNEISNELYVRSVEYGRRVADAVYHWSATDKAGHEGYLHNNDPTYTPPAGPGLWQPTYPDFAPALLPRWGSVRTFAADASDIVPNPLPMSTSPGAPIYQQAVETQRLVNQIKAGEKYEDRWIADFWSDDCPILTFTPAGRWIAVANQAIENNRANLALAVETYARVGMAIADAGIRSWGEKYRFNVERPIDYIRRVMNDPNWNTVMCPDGSGQFFTPPFPAYPSGHATFGAAAAEVLTALYGNTPFTDRCHEGRTEFLGNPRQFDHFYEMAEESAYSRIPIGVHFRMDSEAGLGLGYRVGRKINDLPWRK
ncbi:MAG: phosphatase PAP2 family protein [Haliscomenobacter sp.]|nr:phosphatase PAP2 family protein [Haliscomenobacter sp.]MBK8656203.1 phosphatase PAP2 family protein [Haliscomenobacter sp.]MBP9076756.1 phosphatase PAP2 family protein [Haliscomenobacter sp.]MBP9872657.1 phosphatase PAP2 family protein [Haliscomenobacter sp.]